MRLPRIGLASVGTALLLSIGCSDATSARAGADAPELPAVTPLAAVSAEGSGAGFPAGSAARSGAVTLVADAKPRRTAGDSELAAGPVPDGAIGIGVAYDPSPAGMASVSRGVTLAVEQLNRTPNGPRFAARTNTTGIVSAVQIATELRDDPGVVGVVGHSESGATLDALAVYEDAEGAEAKALVAVSPTATSPRLSGRSRWFFRVCPSDLAASRAVARYALDSLGARRAAIVYRNDSYGRDWTKEFVAVFTAGGGAIVQRDPYLAGITEWEAYAGYMRAQRADVFLFPGSLEDAELAIRELRSIGADIPFIGGDAASALAASGREFAGARYTAFFDAREAASPEAKAFVATFRARFGTVPDQRAALAYDAAMLIGEAARAAGADRKLIRNHLERLGRDLPAVAGVAGVISFDEMHDPRDKRVIVARVEAP